MSKKFPHGIDLSAPGGLAELFAVHRAISGDLVMEDQGDIPPVPAQPPLVPPIPAQPPAVPAPADDVAAQLLAANTAREKAETDLAAAQALIQAAADAQLSDIDKANKIAADKEVENVELRKSVARLTALANNPVPADYQHLVTGTDAASFEASAKAISELAAKAEGKKGPSWGSGTRPNDPAVTGGSINEYRQQIAARKNK